MTARRRTIWWSGSWAAGVAATAVLVLSACATEPLLLAVAGTWNIEEELADHVHQVTCHGEGILELQQVSADGGVADVTGPYDGITGTSGVDTDCVSLDGPFNYFGNGMFNTGVVTPSPDNVVQWEGTVTSAYCTYRGTVSGTPPYASDMTGTLACSITNPGVTFNFEGTWAARNWRSEWCSTRRELDGCSEGS